MNKLFKKNEVLTIPNLLSLFRLVLIPIIIWLYVGVQDYYAATGVIILSALTDIADGIIARKFNMISNFGKILDPIADKFTQGILIICLAFKHRLMVLLVILFVLKECAMVVLGTITIKKNDSVNSAKWHGKLNTVVLYGTMLVLILFPDIPRSAVNAMITVCIVTMMLSLMLYTRFYMSLWKKSGEPAVK